MQTIRDARSLRALPRRSVLAGALAALIGLVAFAAPAWAQTVAEAKDAGLIGERPDGLLGVVQASAAAQALVDRVNAERMTAYRNIAAQNNLPLDVVQARAGAQLIERASPGHYIMTPQGAWVRR